MPIVYRCKRCGYVLHVTPYVGFDSFGVPTPSELAYWYGGVCPRCGSPLNTKPGHDDVRVYPDGLERLKRLVEEEMSKPVPSYAIKILLKKGVFESWPRRRR